MPTTDWPFLDSNFPLAFAHRGVHLNAGENSTRSFEAAVNLGFKYIESDVRATADRQLIMCHDKNASRLFGLAARISDLTLRELQSSPFVRAGGTDVPLLEDVLAAFPDLRFNLDVKDMLSALRISDIVQSTNSYDRVCIASFSTARIRCVRARIARPTCTSASIAEVMHFIARPRSFADRAQPAVLQVPLSIKGISVLSGKFIASAHDAGLPVHVWTLNDVFSIRKAVALGADGIISDEPVLLRSELMLRGLWPPDPPDTGNGGR
jgi:glycerophosphoryl diester phosphodiesterase